MLSASDIFRSRGGIKLGPASFLVRCPCSAHKNGDRNPSLQISGSAGERPRFHCHAGGDWREIAALLGADINHSAPQSEPTQDDLQAERKKREWQAGIIRTAITTAERLPGTIGEDYLRWRGVWQTFDETVGMSLLYHNGLRFGSRGEEETAPGIVAIMRPFADVMREAFRDLENPDALQALMRRREYWQAIHRTRLTDDGRKHSRSMFGPNKGAVIFLDDPFEIAGRQIVTVAEGIESALSARMRGFRGCIAAANAGAIAALPVIDGMREIVLCAENDIASRKAIEQCAARWAEAGASVSIVQPRDGVSDLNDLDRQVA